MDQARVMNEHVSQKAVDRTLPEAAGVAPQLQTYFQFETGTYYRRQNELRHIAPDWAFLTFY